MTLERLQIIFLLPDIRLSVVHKVDNVLEGFRVKVGADEVMRKNVEV